MKIGKVIGKIWATRKDEHLEGYKLLLVQPLNILDNSRDSVPIVAADTIGAGEGEMVIFVGGSSARNATRDNITPVDATIVGIVDDLEIKEKTNEKVFVKMDSYDADDDSYDQHVGV